jgi:hypothetical protein
MGKVKAIFVMGILCSGILMGLSLTKPEKTFANTGYVELRSTNNESYRCYASSLIIPNNKFDVAINCVDLLFPINPPQLTTYMVWANPPTGNKPVKLGDLGKGVARFEVAAPFSSLFITVEANQNPRNPGAITVMRGNVEPINFLQRATSPTPTLEPEDTEEPTKAEEKPNDTTNLSTKDKLLLALRRAGIAALIALIAIVGLIFVVTRSRG